MSFIFTENFKMSILYFIPILYRFFFFFFCFKGPFYVDDTDSSSDIASEGFK